MTWTYHSLRKQGAGHRTALKFLHRPPEGFYRRETAKQQQRRKRNVGWDRILKAFCAPLHHMCLFLGGYLHGAYKEVPWLDDRISADSRIPLSRSVAGLVDFSITKQVVEVYRRSDLICREDTEERMWILYIHVDSHYDPQTVLDFIYSFPPSRILHFPPQKKDR